MPSIPTEQIKKAAAALDAYVKGELKPQQQKKSQKASLFDKEEEYQLIITLRKIPEGKVKPYRLPIPHTYHGREGARICLITKDPQADYEALLDKYPIPGVKAVYSVSTLRKDFQAFQHRRELLSEFDFFVADDRIVTLLPTLLGKAFFVTKKQPVPVDISKNFKKDIIAARDCTYMFLSKGVTVNIRVGNQDFSAKQIAENVAAAIEGAVKHIPRQWKNIQSIYLKTTHSVALPIYTSLATVEDFIPSQDEIVNKENETKLRAELAERRKAAKWGLSLVEMKRFEERAKEMNITFPQFMALRKKNELPPRASIASAEELEKDIAENAKKMVNKEDEIDELEDEDEDLVDLDDMDEDQLMALLEELADEDEDLIDEDDMEDEEPTPAPVEVKKVTNVAAKKNVPEPVKAVPAPKKTTSAPAEVKKTTPAPIAAKKTTPAPVVAQKRAPEPVKTAESKKQKSRK